MIEIKSILSPVDFSEVSLSALEHAAKLAQWFQASLTILHVDEPPVTPLPSLHGSMPVAAPLTTGPTLSEADFADAVKQFATTVDTAGLEVQIKVRTDSPVSGIVEEAEGMGADLIVLGTHGRTGFDRLVLGSVAEKVLRRSTRPVMTVPPESSEPPRALGRFKRILCAVDFSEASRKAVDYVLPFAKEADAEVILVHVIEGVPDSAALRTTLASAYAEDLRAMESVVGERLQALVPDHARPWCRPSTLLLRGKAYSEILRAVNERDIRLIVMGIHGPGSVSRFFFGSTANHVIRSATCPVLTLRS